MSERRRRGIVRSCAAFLFAVLTLASCATKPAAVKPSAPAAKAAQAAIAPAVSAVPTDEAAASAGTPLLVPPSAPKPEEGTTLKTADPAALARGREEREAIESSIVFGSPSSLAHARELASRAAALKAEDAAALDSIARGIASLVYPGTASPSSATASKDTASSSGLSGAAQSLLSALGEVSAGRSPEVSAESAGSSLGELIPALVVFSLDSSDSARKAFDALDRFARLGVPSILPSLIRGVDAERRADWQGALGLYRSALAIAPDAWVASLGSARAFLALRRSADALAALAPLVKAHSGLAAFDRAYALALYAAGRYDEAEPYVARALTRDPQDSQLVILRARFLIRAKAYQQALPLLDAYGTIDPASRLYLLLRSLDSEGLRSREEALKWARRGLASYPDDPELLVVAARLLFAGPAFGHEEARTLAARVCSLVVPGAAAPADSDSESGAILLASRNAAAVEAARLLARDAASRFKWADAATYLARAGSAFDDKQAAALILRKSGDPAAALEYASSWYREEPRSPAATEAYLRALIDAGNEKAAQDAIARLLPGTSSPPLRSILYFLQARMQKSDEAALTLLRAALVENADNAEALTLVSDIQLRRKDYAKARFYLKQAMAIDPGDPELESRQKKLEELAPQ
jgi:tetratricopeptide (TPR) repeat protein